MTDDVKFNICKLFADDCKLYGIVNMRPKTNYKWIYTNWKNGLRNGNCHLMPPNARPCTLDIKTSNKLTSHIEKDLGVTIDNNLKIHNHTAKAGKKANQILSVLKKSYNTRDKMTICTLYKVRPHLEYGNMICSPFYQEDIKKNESIQKRVTKLISQLKDKTYEERLREL